MSQYRIELLYRPGQSMGHEQLKKLHRELVDVAATCLEQIPHYQCLTGERRELSRLVIAVARDASQQMVGFCSAYLLDGGEGEEILHLGLTCVRPDRRGGGLTHKLTAKVVIGQLLRRPWHKPLWISNVACVLSSLGNVGLHFDEVYPSPAMSEASEEHLRLARRISAKYRQELLIPETSHFDESRFVFQNSVSGTAFAKEAEDRRFYHRDAEMNAFYKNLIIFERGDEVLQIGKVSFASYPRHLLQRLGKRLRTPEPVLAA